MRSLALAALSLVLSLAAPPAARADSVLFKDGRSFDVEKIEEAPEHLTLIYPHGTVVVPKTLLADWHAFSAAGDYTPKNDEERAKVEKGLVPHEGKWIAKAARDAAIKKKNKQREASLAEQRKRQNWRDRYQDETAHFAFEYTVPPQVANGYKDLFEVYFNVFAKEWGVKQPAGKKLKVCFYHDYEDFRRIGNAPGALGYFRFVEPIELNFFYERRDERLTLDVLFHETNHYLFHLYTKPSYQLPAWIEEGLAEYYGASIWDPSTKTMTVGHLQEGRLVNLKDAIDGDDRQDLKDLMASPRIDALQYAWAWSLCHMFMEDPQLKPKFKAYVKKLATDGKIAREDWPANPNYTWVKPGEALDLFQKTMGFKDLDAVEAQWYAYIDAMDVVSDRGYHDAAMFCLRWDRPLRAKLYFEKAVSLYSKNPETYMQYGRLLLGMEKHDDAIKAFETGLKLDPMEPYFYRELGRAHRAKGNEKHGRELQILACELDRNDIGLIAGFDEEMLAELASTAPAAE